MKARALKIGAVILAAGEGARLGGVAKALLERDGETFLARVVRTARAIGLRDEDAVVVVGPPFADDVTRAARALGIRVALNDDPTRGMASSVAIGFGALMVGDADAAWLWPVDHPDVDARTLARLVSAIEGHVVAKPRFVGRHGHPPLIGRSCFGALAACANERGGARTVLARAASETAIVDVDDAGVIRDVDEEE